MDLVNAKLYFFVKFVLALICTREADNFAQDTLIMVLDFGRIYVGFNSTNTPVLSYNELQFQPKV